MSLFKRHEVQYVSERDLAKAVFSENYDILSQKSGGAGFEVTVMKSQPGSKEIYLFDPHSVSTEGNVPFRSSWYVWEGEIKLNGSFDGT